MKFGGCYPIGPCPHEWEGCVCDCGWVFNADEMVKLDCDDDCDTCHYCGNAGCPQCGNHLHCGGCI